MRTDLSATGERLTDTANTVNTANTANTANIANTVNTANIVTGHGLSRYDLVLIYFSLLFLLVKII